MNDQMKYTIRSGIETLGGLVAAKTGKSDPCGNSGSKFENDVFSLEAYCWCDGDSDDHNEHGCPPNFYYKQTGFSASWYKHINRGFECDEISSQDWMKILSDCIQSLR